MRNGPLTGIRIVELVGLGPGPMASMILADLGAEVISVERPGGVPNGHLMRSRRVLAADLKDPDDLARVLNLIDGADVLIEGNRPGVTERLGLGPDICCARNPRLIYARMTGWGQTGAFAHTAGHDINYIAVTGILESIGRPGERPVPPLNLVGDYGGGSMFLVTGVLAALLERTGSGRGQVIDAAMCDGASVLAMLMWSLRGSGLWQESRGRNMLDGSRPYYDTYECADGRSMAVGCIEPQFYATMLEILGLDAADLPDRDDETRHPDLRAAIAAAFKQKTMAEWASVFGDADACVTPVLTFTEALDHPHMSTRGVFTTLDGVEQPLPAPRFSRTPCDEPTAPRAVTYADWQG